MRPNVVFHGTDVLYMIFRQSRSCSLNGITIYPAELSHTPYGYTL